MTPQELTDSFRPLVDDKHPWPGLSAFQEKDREFFHGRDDEIRELHRLIGRGRLTLLYGISGLGKTSLLHAGLFPRLRDEDGFPVYVRLDHGDGAPDLIEQVRTAIRRAAEAAGVEPPDLGDGSLWEIFHRHDAEFWSERNRLLQPVLVFDQFEEIFTLGRRDADTRQRSETFLTELADLVEGRTPAALVERLERAPETAREFSFSHHDYKVVLALREEFLPEIDSLRQQLPAVAGSRLRLQRMSGGSACRAVVLAGGEIISGEVAEAVVRFVAADRENAQEELADLQVEPALLSVVCRELNAERLERSQPTITLDLLEGSREEILSDFYERSFEGLAPGRERSAYRTFVEEKLLTVTGFRDSVAWDNALEMPGIAAEGLQALVGRRLLRIEESGRGGRIELTHDLLAGVVAASRSQRRMSEELEEERRRQQRRLEELEEQRRLEVLRRKAGELVWTRRFAVAVSVLTLVAVLSMLFALRQRDRAEEARTRVQRAVVQSANLLIESGRVPGGIAYLAQALRQDPDQTEARLLVFDSLLRRRWPLIVAVLRDETLQSARLSPDGTRLVTATSDGTLTLWDTATRQVLGEPVQLEDRDVRLAFSSDGSRLLATSSAENMSLWKVEPGALLSPPLLRETGTVSARFRDAGRIVAATGGDGVRRLWDASTGRPADESLPAAPERGAGDVAVPASVGTWLVGEPSPDGRLLLIWLDDGRARLWDVAADRPLGEPLGQEEHVDWAHFSADGRRLLTISRGQVARVWNVEIDHPLGEVMYHESDVDAAVFSPDGRWVATASKDHSARLWDRRSGLPRGQPMRHRDWVRSVEFSPDGSRVVTASRDATARLWDAVTGEPSTASLSHEGPVVSAHFSPGGGRVVTASEDGSARLWDAATGAPLGEPLRHKGPVTSALFSPDGKRIVTASRDNTARLWDGHTGAPLAEPMLHVGWVESVDFSPDGRQLVTAARDRTVRFWDAASSESLREPLRLEDEVIAARFSPDGELLLTTLRTGETRLWDATSLQPIGVPLRGGQVLSARFSPDARYVATASFDGIARLWDARTGQPLGDPWVHRGPVLTAEIRPDGAQVVTGSQDGTARMWDLPAGSLADSQPLARLAEAVAGYRVNSRGALVPVAEPAAELEALRGEAEQAGADGAWNVWDFVLWFLADRSTRTVSPFSETTTPECRRREAEWLSRHSASEP